MKGRAMRRGAANLVWGSALLGVCAAVTVLNVAGPQSWANVGVPTFAPRWADTHAITQDAECRSRGVDPWTPNRCNSYIVPNYPRVWLTIADLLGRSDG